MWHVFITNGSYSYFNDNQTYPKYQAQKFLLIQWRTSLVYHCATWLLMEHQSRESLCSFRFIHADLSDYYDSSLGEVLTLGSVSLLRGVIQLYFGSIHSLLSGRWQPLLNIDWEDSHTDFLSAGENGLVTYTYVLFGERKPTFSNWLLPLPLRSVSSHLLLLQPHRPCCYFWNTPESLIPQTVCTYSLSAQKALPQCSPKNHFLSSFWFLPPRHLFV